jgi:hypothetical protein
MSFFLLEICNSDQRENDICRLLAYLQVKDFRYVGEVGIAIRNRYFF